METTLKVSKIKDGTVIDHVPAGKALRVVSILKIENNPDVSTTIAMRVQSEKLGRKDVIKVENKYLNRDDLDRISLVAPDATISIVSNYQIKEKFTVKLTKTIVGAYSIVQLKLESGQNLVTSMGLYLFDGIGAILAPVLYLKPSTGTGKTLYYVEWIILGIGTIFALVIGYMALNGHLAHPP